MCSFGHFFGWKSLGSGCIVAAAFLLFLITAHPSEAQVRPQFGGHTQLQEATGLLRNAVTTLAAQGDTLWAGPYLQRTTDGGQTWRTAEAPELERQGNNRLFSLTLSADTLVAGIGTTAADAPAAAGFLVSTDGGESFAYRLPHLDDGTQDTLRYGASTLPAIPVTDPRQSPPYDVALGSEPGEVWVAGGQSGLRRSQDFGETWKRVVVPPDFLDEITPPEFYDFTLRPPSDGQGHANYEAYSVLVDESGTVWAGTGAGINRSTQGDVFIEFDGDRRWTRTGTATAPDGLTGDLVAAIAEQPTPGLHNAIWMATWATGVGQQSGVSVTRDGGDTYEHVLLGERIHDFGFRGDTALAAGDNGLFFLDAEGEIIRHETTFNTPDQPDYDAPPSLTVLAVATTREAIWAGTEDGLFRSVDGGDTWRVFRAEVPTSPEDPTEDMPAVETYAYPNPFSPSTSTSGFVRFVVEVQEARDVQVRILDFSMNPVRQLNETCHSGGRCEVAWDGTDASGRQVANGTYFYTVRTDAGRLRGKVVVVD